MLIIALANAMKMQKEYRWEAFIDTFLLDQFSYAHKYFKKGNKDGMYNY